MIHDSKENVQIAKLKLFLSKITGFTALPPSQLSYNFIIELIAAFYKNKA